MRDDQRRLWSVVGAALALLLATACTAAPGAASPGPSAESSPSASLAPTVSPSASTGFVCESPSAQLDPSDEDHILRGATVKVRFEGLAPNSVVTLVFMDWSRGVSERPIGTAETDTTGKGAVEGVLPSDAPIGEAELQVVAADGCYASAYIVVLGSEAAVSVDDDTVRLGQLVTITAGGFLPQQTVSAFINGGGVQEECPGCHWLATARTTADGSVVVRVLIPRDTSLGAHHLGVHGTALDGVGDQYLVADITVRAGSLPPTDTD
jgi:hypothetical protein